MPLTAPVPAVGLHPGLANTLHANLFGAPIAADSEARVAALRAQVAELYGGVAAFNTSSYSLSIVAADPTTPRVAVRFRDSQRKGYLPSIFAPGGVLSAVPIPREALPAPGLDGHLAILHDGGLTELWQARREADGAWSAVWGGRIDNLATTTGQYPEHTGVSASGLIAAQYALGLAELRAGRIDHAVGVAVTRVQTGAVSWPATRTDGRSTAADALTMGQRFRLPAAFDLAAVRHSPDWRGITRPLHPIARMVGEAAKVFGLIVVDSSHGVNISGEFGGNARLLTGVDPWPALLARTPAYAVLAGFPWHALEALPLDHAKPAPPPPVSTPAGAS